MTISKDLDSDKRERLQALSLAKECYAMKLDLLSSATVVERAVQFVERNKGLLEQRQNGKELADYTSNTIAGQ
jgi:hypothetical protein